MRMGLIVHSELMRQGFDRLGSNEHPKPAGRRRRLLRFIIYIAFCAIFAYLIAGSWNRAQERRSPHTRIGKSNSTQESWQTHAGKARRLPQALIIGTRKSGTRALLRFLEINPAIKPARREVHFFDRDANYQLGLDWYRSQMPETSSHEITIEKSPAYFVTREAPERIKAMNASVKLVVIFRNPVTRMISDFSQTIANRLEEPSSLDDYYDHEPDSVSSGSTRSKTNATLIWREAEKEFRRHILRPDGGIDERRRIVRIGMYSTHLERWLSILPPNQFHFVDGEKLIQSPHLELRKLEAFLGLAPMISENHFVFNPNKGFYCLVNETLTRQQKETNNNNNDGHQGGSVCLGKSKGRRHVAVDSKLLETLQNFYEPYNEYLESLTGLSFNV